MNSVVFPVELKPSTLAGAGRGVFVTRSVPAGRRLCWYDGEMVRDLPDRDIDAYTLCLTPHRDLVGVPDVRHPGGMAQLINDIYRPTSNRDQRRYDRESEKCNVIFVRDRWTVWAESTRPLQKGEELFVSYGFPYWKT